VVNPSLDLDALVPQFHRKLVGRAFAITRDREDAEDAVQAVWLKLATTGATSWRGDCAIGSWLYLLTSHEAITLVRRRSRWGRPAHHEPLDVAINRSIDKPSPYDYAVAREVADHVIARMPQLTRSQRKIVLKAARGVDLVTIARRHHTKLNTIKTKLSRGRRKLR
jgi:RNA polymerase sigma factor (sigma-70 family)